MNRPADTAVRTVETTSDDAGQRIDNYLMRVLRGVPRGHVYRLLRRGEVRVNGGRVRPVYRLAEGDRVRIPPVREQRHAEGRLPNHLLARLKERILLEDDAILVIDKPAGLAVHAGSGLGGGLIDGLRELRPDLPALSLVHRLDRDTSGCLLLAKNRRILRELQRALRDQRFEKTYQAVLVGDWAGPATTVDAPLLRDVRRGNERIVRVDPVGGQHARSRFQRLAGNGGLTRVEVIIETGRTHQIRVHAAHLGFPVLGDDKYGNRRAERAGLGQRPARLYLHAWRLAFPLGDRRVEVESPVPREFATLGAAAK
jgi:23S rRNA pseudouridine955/2504/2580 synthase